MSIRPGAKLAVVLVLGLAPIAARAQDPGETGRYTLVLEDPPAAGAHLSMLAVSERLGHVRLAQQAVRARLDAKGVRVLGAVDTLLNALFVQATASRREELAAIAGVKGVVPSRQVRPALNKVATVVNAPAAWVARGGAQYAGRGVKIGIVDSGIDQNHPAFSRSTLNTPIGFPKCGTPTDCISFTNRKVIVARSFVNRIAAGSDPHNPAADSRPDDLSPRDRLGHGTAVAACAAGESVGGLVSFNGIAPGAWLGNYKVFGSPGVNDSASDQEIIAALEQAVKDGMDIVNLSLGELALTGPLDSGADCGVAAGVPCDLVVAAVEAAVRQGVVVVVSAGNDNNTGTSYPTYNTVGTPADAPSAITVGASSNAHVVMAAVSVTGQPSLQSIQAVPGSTGLPLQPLTATLVDVAATGNDGQACSPLPPGSLYHAIALIKNSGCTHVIQAENAIAAGAVGVILYAPGAGGLSTPSMAQLPAVAISNADGLALKAQIAAHPGTVVTIGASEQANTADQMLHFSSIGPNPGDSAIKPDLVAPGGGTWGFDRLPGIYTAVQSYDSWGDLYNPDSFSATQGTSFAAPIVAGAAALVKQAHPGFTPAQIKSALVSTAAQTILTDDTPAGSGHGPYSADTQWFGGGRLDVGAAVASTVTATANDASRSLASLSFGVVTAGSMPITRQLTLTNSGSAAVNLGLAVASAHGGLAPSVFPSALTLDAGQSSVISVTLNGGLPAAGQYSGAVTISGAGVPLRVPYMYLVSDGVAGLMIGSGANFQITAGSQWTLRAKVLDRFGAPLPGVRVHWINDSAKGTLASDYSTTDKNGVAAMSVTLDQNAGDHPNWAVVGDLSVYLNLVARPQPTIDGVVNAASFDPNQPIAPGSYIAIFAIAGKGFGDLTGPDAAARLPLAMGGTFVSFDVPSAGISVPGRLLYASPGQINLQAPWELQGQTSVQVKVGYGAMDGRIYGKVATVRVADYSPAFFEVGGGMAAAQDLGSELITAGHPVGRGEIAILYANGLGPVTNTPLSGEPAVANPLSEIPPASVVVIIGGQPAEVLWAGLSPSLPGLYQINVRVPANIPAGSQSMTVAAGGKTSKASSIVVR